MAFKLIIMMSCASMALISCAFIDEHNMLQRQKQKEMLQHQSDQIREHQQLEQQQRQTQIRQLEEQRRAQEQMIRNQERETATFAIYPLTHRQEQLSHVVHIRPAPFINIPSSTRNFNVYDDSRYNFGYAVADMTTGDIKSHQETRRGDQVEGQYTMMDSDGFHRTVSYRANDQNGFDAEVKREPAYVAITQPQVYYPVRSQIVADVPAIYASTSVSRQDNDGKRNQYSTATSSNF
jgi:TolA-binding protein